MGAGKVINFNPIKYLCALYSFLYFAYYQLYNKLIILHFHLKVLFKYKYILHFPAFLIYNLMYI